MMVAGEMYEWPAPPGTPITYIVSVTSEQAAPLLGSASGTSGEPATRPPLNRAQRRALARSAGRP